MNAKCKYKAIRGMAGTLPEDNPLWRTIEQILIAILESYSYDEIRLPIVEYSDVFNRSIGESTDIVQKEMYTFLDRNGESLTLRPEGTAGCVRSTLENNLLAKKLPQRLWYHGPMFRYERPQRGRQRQFHQIGLEIFGTDSVLAEVELILIFAKFWKEIGLSDIKLEINSLGTTEDRLRYRRILTEYFSDSAELLDEHSKQKLNSNPFRLLDSKDPNITNLVNDAPSMTEYLSEKASFRLELFKKLLSVAQINFIENSKLVRGLDYYSDIVFEWTTTSLGAQNAICAGGRYDTLIAQLGGKPTAAVGCAVGLERVIEICRQTNSVPAREVTKVYILATDKEFQGQALLQSQKLREKFPGICFELDMNESSLKSKMKKADKSGAEAAIIIGQKEIEENILTIKPLREEKKQKSCKMSEIGIVLPEILG